MCNKVLSSAQVGDFGDLIAEELALAESRIGELNAGAKVSKPPVFLPLALVQRGTLPGAHQCLPTR